MKLKNIKVGDTLEVKSSIVDGWLNDKLSPDMLCKVTYVEPAGYCGDLTVQVAFDDDVDWVNHRHLRKPRTVPAEEVTPLSRWAHSNGSTYAVLLITNENSEDQDHYPTTVVYRDYDGRTWSRPLSDWHRSMTKMED